MRAGKPTLSDQEFLLCAVVIITAAFVYAALLPDLLQWVASQ